MSVIAHGDFGVNYAEYRFGHSKQFFRGPKPELGHSYIAMLGGGETFGRFVQRPYPEILADELPLATANFGLDDAGPNFYLHDPVLLDICSRAKLCVISVPHGYAVSNRLYSVMHRANHKLKAVSETLQSLYPDVDFASFRSVRQMLVRLHEVNSANFKVVRIELRRAWVARMRELIGAIDAPCLLVWISDKTPEEARFDAVFTGMGPQMVDRVMLEDLQGHADEFVEYVASPDCRMPDGSDRIFGEGERDKALQYPGGEMHLDLAERLYPSIRSMLHKRAPHRVALRRTLELLGF